LEREFRLLYNIPGLTLETIRNLPVNHLEWFYNRLIKQLKDEDEKPGTQL
jgi:hypothetical protein